MVTIRTLAGCRYRHALRANIFGRAVFFLWRLVWTASALDHLLICCSAPNTEGVIISRAYQRCRVHVVRYCVAAELEDFDRDPRTDGLIYTAANLIHSRPSFLEFLRQSTNRLRTLLPDHIDPNSLLTTKMKKVFYFLWFLWFKFDRVILTLVLLSVLTEHLIRKSENHKNHKNKRKLKSSKNLWSPQKPRKPQLFSK